ncbi:uncharacterized protein LOC122660030 [Telopea speciosissima]|uniref:uncharacterized protein LOC122660030 n=1 Tax=Telopea speciosissima TaxID=54955 RepID=UPI001CC3B9D3|nr:uncharacterized protein LOC122660030 [Telopea speciosissima]
MEQKWSNTSSRMELKDFFTSNLNDCENATQRNHSWQGALINVNEGYLGNNLVTNCKVSMSNEESKIRAELETDVEKDLEDEIKDGICHLARRLHRLYQHQTDKNERESSKSDSKTGSTFDNKTFSEVKITIRMEARGSQIEIHEIKKAARENPPQPRNSRSEGKQGKVFPGTKKFNWVDTLRSGNSPAAIINKKHELPWY